MLSWLTEAQPAISPSTASSQRSFNPGTKPNLPVQSCVTSSTSRTKVAKPATSSMVNGKIASMVMIMKGKKAYPASTSEAKPCCSSTLLLQVWNSVSTRTSSNSRINDTSSR